MNAKQEAFNLIFTGVGGQGNVLASQLIGQAFVAKGFYVTIGETYGASQRGGPVMSHIRICKQKQRSPLIPQGSADVVVAMEPVEALRVLAVYGNPHITVLFNPRPIHPIDVMAGDETYPELEEIMEHLQKLSRAVYRIDATERALRLGAAILGNMIMVGALLQLKLIPLSVAEFCEILRENMPVKNLDVNLEAIEEGRKAIVDNGGQ